MMTTPSPRTIELSGLPLEEAGVVLHSAFQPIVSVAHGRIVGHEALLRGHDLDQRPMTPAELFPRLVQSMASTEVHGLCTRLHLETFANQRRDGWLFLNANPSAMADRQAVMSQYDTWLENAGIPPHRVVVEIIETRVHDERRLAEAVGGFRDLGCLVAIDDFGAGESNFERIWRLRPDVVKIDRAMIAQASDNPLVRRILPGIVSLLHEAGCLVVMEGIETESQALLALESGADFVQGFYFSLPSAGSPSHEAIRKHFTVLTKDLRQSEEERSATDLSLFTSFGGGLEACAAALEDGVDFFDACSTFLAVAGVQRMYQLDSEGEQVGHNAESPDGATLDPRFAPCADGAGASWFRRPYFQRAMRNPGHVQVSRPYLSVRDGRTCVTISICVETPDGVRVLCADLDCDQAEPMSRRAPRESGILPR